MNISSLKLMNTIHSTWPLSPCLARPLWFQAFPDLLCSNPQCPLIGHHCLSKYSLFFVSSILSLGTEGMAAHSFVKYSRLLLIANSSHSIRRGCFPTVSCHERKVCSVFRMTCWGFQSIGEHWLTASRTLIQDWNSTLATSATTPSSRNWMAGR